MPRCQDSQLHGAGLVRNCELFGFFRVVVQVQRLRLLLRGLAVRGMRVTEASARQGEAVPAHYRCVWAAKAAQGLRAPLCGCLAGWPATHGKEQVASMDTPDPAADFQVGAAGIKVINRLFFQP